jgi:hypothetical protein
MHNNLRLGALSRKGLFLFVMVNLQCFIMYAFALTGGGPIARSLTHPMFRIGFWGAAFGGAMCLAVINPPLSPLTRKVMELAAWDCALIGTISELYGVMSSTQTAIGLVVLSLVVQTISFGILVHEAKQTARRGASSG